MVPWDRSKAKSIARTTAIVIVCAVGFIAVLRGCAALKTSQDNAAIVKAYCSGAVSQAQYQGCRAHVSRARIDQLANRGDATAINAENVTCSPGNAWQEGDC
jgi:hypothetical protein